MTSKIYNWVQEKEQGRGFIAIAPQEGSIDTVYLRYTDDILRLVYADGSQLNLPTPPEGLKEHLAQSDKLLVAEMDDMGTHRTYYAEVMK